MVALSCSASRRAGSKTLPDVEGRVTRLTAPVATPPVPRAVAGHARDSTASPEAVLDGGQAVRKALLSAADLPSGWSAFAESPRTVLTTAFMGCGQPVFSLQVAAAQGVAFARQTPPPVELRQIIVPLADGSGKQEVDHLVETLISCRSFTNSDQPDLTYQVVPLSFPELAEQSAAFSITSYYSQGGQGVSNVFSNLVLARRGDYLMYLFYSSALPVDEAEVESLAHTAATKFAGLPAA